MIFANRIKSVRPNDRVLEIGPGVNPHPRSNVFLELNFSSEPEKVAQRGGVTGHGDFRSRPVHYYDGTRFPFSDSEFDYVICSHVIEHVPDPHQYLSEVFRVSRGRGYLEYPLATYEYLYNFPVHLHFVKFDAPTNTLLYLPKTELGLERFAVLNSLLCETLSKGWNDLCASNPDFFFEGFEFTKPFGVARAHSLAAILPPLSSIREKTRLRILAGRLLNKFGF